MAKFITVEGGDGSGKSTLLARIQSHLKDKGLPFITTREPGGTPVAEEIREIILRTRQGEENVSPLCELLLYEAARAQHVDQLIRPALKKGIFVLCDRFTHSTQAYQGTARKLGEPLVEQLNRIATQGVEPDVVIWLKVSPEEAQKRVSKRQGENRLDQEGQSFHEQVFDAFCRMAEREPRRFIVLDASQTPDEIFSELLAHPRWQALFT